MLEIKYRAIDSLRKLKDNPRRISKDEMETLKSSIMANPDYFEARPVILSNRTGELVIIAGNQRYEAAKSLGMSEIPTVLLEGLSEEREREITIRDNVSNGDWDYDELANSWDLDELSEWGVDIPNIEKTKEDNEARLVPVYVPKGEDVEADECFDNRVSSELVKEIDSLNCSDELKELMKARAGFFTLFDFEKLAELYASSDDNVRRMFEKLGMVVVVDDDVIEAGEEDLMNGHEFQVISNPLSIKIVVKKKSGDIVSYNNGESEAICPKIVRRNNAWRN